MYWLGLCGIFWFFVLKDNKACMTSACLIVQWLKVWLILCRLSEWYCIIWLFYEVMMRVFSQSWMCFKDVSHLFIENPGLVGPTKMEVVLFGTKVQRKKITTASGGTVVQFCNSWCDSEFGCLTVDCHWSYHTNALWHTRPLLTLDVDYVVEHSFMLSHLDLLSSHKGYAMITAP